MLAILAFALLMHLWGINRNLPYLPEPDERAFVTPAVRIAATGDLNPGWFGHPGSTVIYPLAAAYHLVDALFHGGPFFHANPGLLERFDTAQGEFFFIGRLLTIFYGIMSLPLIYLIGRRLFNRQVGLIACWLALLVPFAVDHAKTVRSDSAAVFFGMLAVWLCLKVYECPSKKHHIGAGLAIGLAIATRYFMVALIPVLLVVDGMILWRKRTQGEKISPLWTGTIVGLSAIAGAFIVTTPYLLLDFTTAVNDLKFEARDTQLGTTGLSHTGNFLWYLSSGIPLSVFWPTAILGLIGVGWVIRERQPLPLLLPGLITVFLVEISLSIQHVQRWVIPILPLIALLAAYALSRVIDYTSTRFRLAPRARQALFVSSIALLSAWPIYQLTLLDIRHSRPSTLIIARQWIIDHLPAGSHIALDRYTAPLTGTDFVVPKHRWLARNHTLEDFIGEDYRYIEVSSAMYDGYLAEPDRYRAEADFYARLFAEGNLLQEFTPSATRDGYVIRIYELREH